MLGISISNNGSSSPNHHGGAATAAAQVASFADQACSPFSSYDSRDAGALLLMAIPSSTIDQRCSNIITTTHATPVMNISGSGDHHDSQQLMMFRHSPSAGTGAGINNDNGKYIRYTPEQVQALERLYTECPKPSSLRRQQLIHDNPILQNIDPKQIKVWFQNRRCREKQRKETSRLQAVNAKLTAINKLLIEENERLQKHVTQLLYENGCLQQQLHQYHAVSNFSTCYL